MTKAFLLLSLLYLSACKSASTTEHTSPLTYEEKSENFEKCIDDACASVELTYPVFEGDTGITGMINREITAQNVQMWLTGDQEYKEMQDAVSSFFESYEGFRTDFPEAAQEWTFETVAKVTHQSDGLISIKFDNFSYLGGAHPNTVVNYLNIDLAGDGDILDQEEMLIDRQKLLQLAEKKFREHHEVDPGISLEEDGRFFLDKGNFFLPFAIGYEGEELVLIYNSYEIGPYSMGRTELRFPLEEMEGVVYLEN